MNIVGTILKGAVETAATFFTRRAELKLERHKADIAVIQAAGERASRAVSEGLAADAAWELESLKTHSHGWKDDAILLMFMIPYVLCFVPYSVDYVHAGFAALDKTPTWYQVASVSIFMAVYGIRWWRREQTDT